MVFLPVVRNLAADGWSVPIDDRVQLQTTPDIHWRIWPFFGLSISRNRWHCKAIPNLARITVSREVIIPLGDNISP